MRRCSILLVVALFLHVFVSEVSGGTKLVINYAEYDASAEAMTLHGANFDSFGELEVWIGDICLTCSLRCTYTSNTVECDLEDTPPATTGGTWIVRVSACNAPHCKDEIHLALQTDREECNSGDYVECYTGAQGTKDVGECNPGVRICTDGSWELECVGETTPVPEICDDSLDNDCDGYLDCIDADCFEHSACSNATIALEGVDPIVVFSGVDVPIVITAINPLPAGQVGFSYGATVMFRDSNGASFGVAGAVTPDGMIIHAIFPAGVTADTYDLIVTNPDKSFGILPDALLVTDTP